MAKESITNVEENQRDISAITMCVSKEIAEKLKAEIQIFRKKLLAIADESTAKEVVYQVNLQLFPLTRT